MNTPHPGLAAAVTLAGNRRKLAERAGCSHSHIGYYWNNGRPLPDKLAVKVAKAVGIKVSALTEPRP